MFDEIKTIESVSKFLDIAEFNETKAELGEVLGTEGKPMKDTMFRTALRDIFCYLIQNKEHSILYNGISRMPSSVDKIQDVYRGIKEGLGKEDAVMYALLLSLNMLILEAFRDVTGGQKSLTFSEAVKELESLERKSVTAIDDSQNRLSVAVFGTDDINLLSKTEEVASSLSDAISLVKWSTEMEGGHKRTVQEAFEKYVADVVLLPKSKKSELVSSADNRKVGLLCLGFLLAQRPNPLKKLMDLLQS